MGALSARGVRRCSCDTCVSRLLPNAVTLRIWISRNWHRGTLRESKTSPMACLQPAVESWLYLCWSCSCTLAAPHTR